MSRASAEINLSAITQNFKSIKSRTTADVLAVVKADAYGHGLIPVSKALEEADIMELPSDELISVWQVLGKLPRFFA